MHILPIITINLYIIYVIQLFIVSIKFNIEVLTDKLIR